MKRSLCLMFVLLSLAWTAAAQTVMKKQPNVTTQTTACSDKVAVTAFSVTPGQATAGQNITVKLSIKNLCSSGSLNVPWEITKMDLVLATGVVQNLAAGATTQVTTQWTSVAGTHQFDGWVDVDQTLNEPSTARANNKSSIVTVTVSPKLVTQYLDYKKAKAAGAQFADNVEGAQTCSPAGQVDPSDNRFGPYPGSRENAAVLFVADCTPANPLGTRATPEAYRNFTLKNGWKVKAVELGGDSNAVVAGGWNWVSAAPSAGSTSPYMKVRVWANGGPTAGFVAVYIRILIEGPEGTNPYQ